MKIKLSYLKLGVFLLIIIAFYGTLSLSGSIQKIAQLIFLGVSLAIMVFILKDPKEQPKKISNVILTALMVATFVLVILL